MTAYVFQVYVPFWMLHMFYLDVAYVAMSIHVVASVFVKCFSCFIYMLHVFIWMLHML
jgi:hypothetical protein